MQGRRVYLEINDDRWISFTVSRYDTLANASQTELEKIQLLSDGLAIGWESLDEVIQVEDVANQRFIHTPRDA